VYVVLELRKERFWKGSRKRGRRKGGRKAEGCQTERAVTKEKREGAPVLALPSSSQRGLLLYLPPWVRKGARVGPSREEYDQASSLTLAELGCQ